MIFRIQHLTSYICSSQVFFEPHLIRLTPRCDGSLEIQEHTLEIDPDPAGTAFLLDENGNTVHRAWFGEMHGGLRLVSSCRIRTLRSNAFDYLLEPEAETLPLKLSSRLKRALGPCLSRRHAQGEDDVVEALTHELVKQTQARTLPFLVELCRHLFDSVSREERQEPGVLPPGETLARASGSCRDTALVFMECCRQAGVPARFVSGYQEGNPDIEIGELHAWAEVFLPGAGWRGFDPTHGLAVADRHVPLAAAPEPEDASPVTGSFRGTGVQARMEHDIRIRVDKG